MAACHDVVRRDPWQPAAGGCAPWQPAAAHRIACAITPPPCALPATEVRAFSSPSQRPAPFSRRRMAIRRSPAHAAAFCSSFCRSRTCGSVHGHVICTPLCNARTSRRMAHASSALPGTKPPTRAPTPGFPAGAAAKVGPSGAHTSEFCRGAICPYRKSPGSRLINPEAPISECRSPTGGAPAHVWDFCRRLCRSQTRGRPHSCFLQAVGFRWAMGQLSSRGTESPAHPCSSFASGCVR